ncbi:hypothetical protein [Clostridium estertheticum]|nr:hypothetical protein [Clostridium estertheticum]MCB2358662.1 hypothetical protein [Clostridium estertheticum]
MSYMILKEDEELIEGIQYIANIYITEEPYSIKMILQSIKETFLEISSY